MLKILRQSFATGVVTEPFPPGSIPPVGFRGKPVIDFENCTACRKCADACPTTAITCTDANEPVLSLSIGDCIFCGECESACPDAIHLSDEYQLSTTHKESLTTRARYRRDADGTISLFAVESTGQNSSEPSHDSVEALGRQLQDEIGAIFGHSLHIREVDAGSCNGCEVEITSLNNPLYDIERFGIQFVASPRHADMLLVTGPVTRNMEIALRQTFEATPAPRIVAAAGACAIHGGIFGTSFASCGGVDKVVPVQVYIPGCPPRPEALLQGILMAIRQLPEAVNQTQR